MIDPLWVQVEFFLIFQTGWRILEEVCKGKELLPNFFAIDMRSVLRNWEDNQLLSQRACKAPPGSASCSYDNPGSFTTHSQKAELLAKKSPKREVRQPSMKTETRGTGNGADCAGGPCSGPSSAGPKPEEEDMDVSTKIESPCAASDLGIEGGASDNDEQ